MNEYDEQQQCLNCGGKFEAERKYCPDCGQKVLQPSDLSFRKFFWHALGDYFHADGKFFASFKTLALQPGLMTVEYLAGKRMKYLHPFRLFLFLSVIYFLLIAAWGTGHGSTPENTKETDTVNYFNMTLTFGDRHLPVDSVRRAVESEGMDSVVAHLYENPNWFQRLMAEKVIESSLFGPEVFFNKLLHHASKIIFILIPFIALLLKLLYIRRKRLYYDHLVFSLHFHSLLFILLIIVQLTTMFLFQVPVWIILIVVLTCLLLAMRRVYRQSWLKTTMKMIALILMYLVIAVPLLAILLLFFTVLV